jgi:hypothetical protein
MKHLGEVRVDVQLEPVWDATHVLTLGPELRPPHEVRTGPRIRRAARTWVNIDLRLTSPSISHALTSTQKRRAGNPT